MTRQEFSTILAEYRKESGPTMKDLCIKLSCLPTDVYRIEKGVHNYNMQKCLDYLAAVGTNLTLQIEESEQKVVVEYAQLVKYIVDLRSKSGYTQRSLAKQVGCSYTAIGLFESHKTTITIDNLLKISDVLNFTLNIKPHE